MLVIVRLREQYGKYFTRFSHFNVFRVLFQKKDKIQKRVQYSHITREIHTITCLSVARKNIHGHKKNWIFNQSKSVY